MEPKKAAACNIQTAASTSCLGSFSKCPLQRVHFIKNKDLYEANILDRVRKLNESKLAIKMESKGLMVLGWGKPEVKTIPSLYYYKEVLHIIDFHFTLHQDNLYVYDIKNAISTFTEHEDPRHAGRSVTFKGLKKDSHF